MFGALIGDLAASQWQRDKDIFYQSLIGQEAQLSEYGITALGLTMPIVYGEMIGPNTISPYISSCFALPGITKQEVSTDFNDWDNRYYIFEAPGKAKGTLAIMAGLIGWIDGDREVVGKQVQSLRSSFRLLDKEEWYALQIMSLGVYLLRHGYPKNEVIKEACFGPVSTWNTHQNGFLSDVVRAWRCFYYAFDFTSTIHNAVRCALNPRLTSALAGMFAEAMYGCEHILIKQQYVKGINDHIRSISYPVNLPILFAPEFLFMKHYKQIHKLFNQKNESATNVERQIWIEAENIYCDTLTEEQSRNIRLYPTSGKMNLYLDDGWYYCCRSGILLARFQIGKVADSALYVIDKVQIIKDEEDAYSILVQTLKSIDVNPREDFKLEVFMECKYYHGKEKCPEEWNINGPDWWKGRLWFGEKVALGVSDINDFIEKAHQAYKEESETGKQAYDALTEIQKVILCHMILNYGCWCPYENLDYLYAYGLGRLPDGYGDKLKVLV